MDAPGSTRGCVVTAALVLALGLLPAAPALAGRNAHPAAHTTAHPAITAQLSVSNAGSLPARARPGGVYVMRGTVANARDRAAVRAVTVALLRFGHAPRTVGRAALRIAARGTTRYTVRVALPGHLSDGAYTVAACLRRDQRSGGLSCATTERLLLIGPAPSPPRPATTRAAARRDSCTSGARTLSAPGARLYPELGNGGYTSVHTDVFMNYDTAANQFLPGTHVVLGMTATQCLTDFGLDFERTNADAGGPNLTVGSVTVDGVPALFRFAQPTYPGDPNGPDDPDANAHAAGQGHMVSVANPLPPACTPAGSSAALNGTQCPADKLVITPSVPIRDGTSFSVTVNYTGTPGLHVDGDDSTEGWFRDSTAGHEGSFVTTEPAATEDWMPLNDHPSAKPTYDFFDTVTHGRTAIANGQLVSTTDNAPDANFPSAGSTTFHWHSPEPIASYLVENSVGDFDLSERVGSTGILFYEAQANAIAPAALATNKAIMDQQEDITLFQAGFNGTYPFTSDGVVIGVPSASFAEEMQTKQTFAGGTIALDTLNHENMHQWWGDNVSEGSFAMTFFKEGFATLGQYLAAARTAATIAGGIGTPAGDAAFESSLRSRFNGNYASAGAFWTVAPSDPAASQLFLTPNTYTRPGTALIALRAILGATRFTATMAKIQADYGGSSITEPQAEAEFHAFAPNVSAACSAELDTFFSQWWDAAYPAGGGPNRPHLTGPGLDGDDGVGPCTSTVLPVTTAALSGTGAGGLHSPTNVTLTAADAGGPGIASTTYSLDGGAPQTYAAPVSIATGGPHTLTYFSTDTLGDIEDPVSTSVTVDATAPVTTASVSPPAVDGIVANASATVTLSATDGAGAGVASTSYSVDAGSPQSYTAPVVVTGDGPHSVTFSSADAVGNGEAATTLAFTIRTPPGPPATTNTTPGPPPATTTGTTPTPPPPPRSHRPAFTALRVKANQKGTKITGSLVVTTLRSTLKLTLRQRGTRKAVTIGTATVHRLTAGRHAFTVELDHAHGLAAQRTHRTLKLTLSVAVTPPGATATTATKTVTLSRATPKTKKRRVS